MLQILICTYNAGICDVPSILLPPAEGIGYVVSMQYTDACFLEQIPDVLRRREDVILSTIAGKGLSANRNNALAHATAEVCVIADDDVRYTLSDLHRIASEHVAKPKADVLLFQATRPQGLLKEYPPQPFDFAHIPSGYYPSSIEITFKRERVKHIPFDLRFGLGSGNIVNGEEEVWLNTLHRKAGRTVCYVPIPIVHTLDVPQGGAHFATNPDVQRAKGAKLYYIYGVMGLLRCVKESFAVARREKAARLWQLLKNTLAGALYIMRTGR